MKTTTRRSLMTPYQYVRQKAFIEFWSTSSIYTVL